MEEAQLLTTLKIKFFCSWCVTSILVDVKGLAFYVRDFFLQSAISACVFQCQLTSIKAIKHCLEKVWQIISHQVQVGLCSKMPKIKLRFGLISFLYSFMYLQVYIWVKIFCCWILWVGSKETQATDKPTAEKKPNRRMNANFCGGNDDVLQPVFDVQLIL